MAAHNTFHLTIASVGETRFDAEAQSVTLPGSGGEFTVLAHHEPLVSTLKEGSVRIRDAEGKQHSFAVDTGVIEISQNHAIVLI